jgi:hypothetical protein
MTAIAVTTVPRCRPLWHRLITALVVVQGGLLWLGGAVMFTSLAGRWNDIFVRFEIRSGLPRATQLTFDVSAALSADWTVTCAFLAVAVACLGLLAALSPSRRAFRWAGWLTVTLFWMGYGMLILMLYSFLLPLMNCDFHAFVRR